MIEVLLLGGYTSGWLLAAVTAARSLAEHTRRCRCHDTGRMCSSLLWHFRGDGTIGPSEMGAASLIALTWPILTLPALAYRLATRRPTAKGLRTRITELERELRMDEGRRS